MGWGIAHCGVGSCLRDRGISRRACSGWLVQSPVLPLTPLPAGRGFLRRESRGRTWTVVVLILRAGR